jgi:dTDP-4-dehydrorhamnose 3,5-epimerase-like enzyme
MNITPTELPGVLVIEPRVFKDDRGLFLETYHGARYEEHGIAWNDPALAIEWPVSEPLLSAKNRSNPNLADVPTELLPLSRTSP